MEYGFSLIVECMMTIIAVVALEYASVLTIPLNSTSVATQTVDTIMPSSTPEQGSTDRLIKEESK